MVTVTVQNLAWLTEEPVASFACKILGKNVNFDYDAESRTLYRLDCCANRHPVRGPLKNKILRAAEAQCRQQYALSLLEFVQKSYKDFLVCCHEECARQSETLPEEMFYDSDEAISPPSVTPAKTLPTGWVWVRYDDGSGHLESPDGKGWFSFDLDTNEYKGLDGCWELMDKSKGAIFEEFVKHAEGAMSDVINEVRSELLNNQTETALGEPQYWLYLQSGRSIEVTFESYDLPETKRFYSVRLHCSDQEFCSYHETVGVIDQVVTDDMGNNNADDFLNAAVSAVVSTLSEFKEKIQK